MKCKRCGRCCGSCRYLVRISPSITACRIYPNRLGTEVSKDLVCVMREDLHQNFDGCPFNKKEWER